MLDPALFKAARDRRLRQSGVRVLILMHERLTYWDYRRVKLSTISREAGLSKSATWKAVDTLVETGYLARGPVPYGKQQTYRLANPDLSTHQGTPDGG